MTNEEKFKIKFETYFPEWEDFWVTDLSTWHNTSTKVKLICKKCGETSWKLPTAVYIAKDGCWKCSYNTRYNKVHSPKKKGYLIERYETMSERIEALQDFIREWRDKSDLEYWQVMDILKYHPDDFYKKDWAHYQDVKKCKLWRRWRTTMMSDGLHRTPKECWGEKPIYYRGMKFNRPSEVSKYKTQLRKQKSNLK